MGPLDLLIAFLCISPVLGADVICPLEDYVLTGIEFSDCQRETLADYNPQDNDSANPCHELERIVTNCAKVLKRCFNDRGWERGKQVFLDLLALQFPKHNDCDVFLQRDDPGVAQQLPGEKCTINEEVALLTQMRICNNQAQTAVVDRILHHHHTHPIGQPSEGMVKRELLEFAFPELCKGLKNVSDACFVPNLGACYDDHDAHFHYVYMVEELKLAGTLLAMHLLSNTTSIDVLTCPVFQDDSPFATPQNGLVLALSLVLSTIIFALLAVVGLQVAKKLRLVPRVIAWMQNEPYLNFEGNRAQASNEMAEVVEDQQQTAVLEPLPSIQDIKNTSTASTFVSLRDQIEEGGQST